MSRLVTVFRSAENAMSSRSSRLVIAIEMVPECPNVFPTSCSVRAGTSAVSEASAPPATPPPSQSISRMATR